jgi:hypothetical protein
LLSHRASELQDLISCPKRAKIRGSISQFKIAAAGRNFNRQAEEIGRRARLRIPKSPISKRSFSFQEIIDLREENATFCCR